MYKKERKKGKKDKKAQGYGRTTSPTNLLLSIHPAPLYSIAWGKNR